MNYNFTEQSVTACENFCKFTGVWQKNDKDEIVSYGTVSWFEIGFTGECIKLLADIRGEVLFYVDDVQVSPMSSFGGENKCEYYFAAQNGELTEHILKICIRSTGRIFLRALALPKGERFFHTPDKTYIQFIGDSITHCCPGFSSATPEALGVDYSVVAFCGMSLKDGWGWYGIPEDVKVRPGMESMYYKLEWPDETYDFTDYKFEFCRVPNALVLFLGTNDYLNSEKDRKNGNLEIFVDAYCRFVKRLLDNYPNSEIFIMKAFTDSLFRNEAIEKAYNRICTVTDKARLIDSDKWEVEISGDGTHPTEKGYGQITEHMVEYLRKNLLRG